jgi:hypothetical protein
MFVHCFLSKLLLLREFAVSVVAFLKLHKILGYLEAIAESSF